MTIEAWHFVNDTLRDGRPVPPDGEPLEYDGDIKLCASGLHASRRIIDALKYAPGSTCCRVACDGKIIQGEDKLVCSKRTILWRVDAGDILHQFARQCALDVVHLWNPSQVVLEFLHGDQRKVEAASLKAKKKAEEAEATWEVASTEMWHEASEASEAAKEAAWSAVVAATVAAEAKWSAAESAWAATLEVAVEAAKEAAWSATWAASKTVTSKTTWYDSSGKQNQRLERLILDVRSKNNV